MYRLRNALRLLALLAILGLARGAEAVPPFLTAYGVDSALGGSMNFTQFAVDYNMGMVMLTAKNFSPTITYQQVGLPFEFFYPGDASGNPTGNGFNYFGAGAWRNAAGTQQLDILGSAPFPSAPQLLSPALINVPLTDSIGPYSASINSTDTVPMVLLGDFAPGVSKSFTVNFSEPIGGTPTPFLFVSSDYFVAIPEPSTIVLCTMGMIGLLVAGRRRWMARAA